MYINRNVELYDNDTTGGVAHLLDGSQMRWSIGYCDNKITMNYSTAADGENIEFTNVDDALDWAKVKFTDSNIDSHTFIYMYDDIHVNWEMRGGRPENRGLIYASEPDGYMDLAVAACETCGGSTESLRWVFADDGLRLIHSFGCHSSEVLHPVDVDEAISMVDGVIRDMQANLGLGAGQIVTSEDVAVFVYQMRWVYEHLI